MSLAILRGSKLCAAAFATAVVASLAVPTAAQAGHHHGDAAAAGVLGAIGGLAVGAAIADSDRPRYRERVYVDEPACYTKLQRVYDSYGNYAGRQRVRVCR